MLIGRRKNTKIIKEEIRILCLFTIVVDTVGCIVAVIIGNILAAGITIQWAKSGFSLSKFKLVKDCFL